MIWAHARAVLQPPAVYCKPTLSGLLPVCSFVCPGLYVPPIAHSREVQLSLVVHACRFVCRQKLGLHADAGAEYVTPLPENAVVYGSGDKAIILTRVSTAGFAAKLIPHAQAAPIARAASGASRMLDSFCLSKPLRLAWRQPVCHCSLTRSRVCTA